MPEETKDVLAVKMTVENDERGLKEKALLQRKQPLMELVYSEEGYVKRLNIVKDCYIPANNYSNMEPTEIMAKKNSQSPPPVVPQSLLPKWRILWGNWLQICEWHSGFLEKLQTLIERDPDKIPKLFIDSRARLRSIYSKYCENHRKAACIAEKHRDYFEELRIYIGDKEDVVSHLMQPVQRIMRYQLPMGEIVKYTERADLPSVGSWKRALEIMKDIPRDTSLILEAAGIEGFPGIITALGSVRIRGPLSIAFVNQTNMIDVIAARHKQLTSLKNISELESNTEEACEGTGTEIVDSLANLVAFHSYTVFLFDQMLLITEECRPGGRKKVPTSNQTQEACIQVDAFAQSVFQFKAAIRVNKMKLAPEWWHCARNIPSCKNYNLDLLFGNCSSPEYGTIDGRFAFWESGAGSVTSMNLSKIPSAEKSSSNGPIYYVVDPITLSTREAWLKQLEDIQQMQQQLLIALQDPTKFGSPGEIDQFRDFGKFDPDSRPPGHQGQRHKSAQTAPISQLASQMNLLHPSTQDEQRSQANQKRWPSFRLKRPSILSFHNNQNPIIGNGSNNGSNNSSSNDKISPSMSENFTTNKRTTLLRSQSVERRKNCTISYQNSNIPKNSDKGEGFFPFSRLNSTSGITPTSWFSRNKKKDSEPALLMCQGLSLIDQYKPEEVRYQRQRTTL